MKISDKHSAAARINGAKSRGPVTPEGKAASSRNSLNHGLLAEIIVLPNEDADAFHRLIDIYTDRFSPADDFEMLLIQEMAAAYWRLRRAMLIESTVLSEDIDRLAEGDARQTVDAFRKPANIPTLDRLQRYQSRHERAFDRALNNLLKARKMAKREEQPPVPNEPIDPCVCNNDEAPRPRPTPRLVPPSPSRPESPAVTLPESPFPLPMVPVFR